MLQSSVCSYSCTLLAHTKLEAVSRIVLQVLQLANIVPNTKPLEALPPKTLPKASISLLSLYRSQYSIH